MTLKVFDVLGREVATLVRAVQSPGMYRVNFDASNVPSGMYFYRLEARASSAGSVGGFVETRKMVLTK